MAFKMFRIAAVVLAFAGTGICVSQASAHPGGGFGGGHGGGFGHGGFGWGHRGGFGWGVAPVVYGGCYLKRFVTYDGELVVRKICY